jgi:hypothetical protein
LGFALKQQEIRLMAPTDTSPEDAITATHAHRLATLSSALTSLIGSATTVEELQWGCGVLSTCPIVEHHNTTSHVVSLPPITLTKGFDTAVRDAVQQLVRVEAAHPQLAVWASSVLTTISNALKNDDDYVPLVGDHYFEEAAPLARLRQASAATVNNTDAQAELRSVCETILRGGLPLPYPTKGEVLSALFAVASKLLTQETVCTISPVITWMFHGSKSMLVDLSLGEIAELRHLFVTMAQMATTATSVEVLSSLYSQVLRDAEPGVVELLFGETAVGNALHSLVHFATSQGAIQALATLVTHIVGAIPSEQSVENTVSCMHKHTNSHLLPSLTVCFANLPMIFDFAMLSFRATTPKTVEAVATMVSQLVSKRGSEWPLDLLVQHRRGLVTMTTHATSADSVHALSTAILAMSSGVGHLSTFIRRRVISGSVGDAIPRMMPHATTHAARDSMALALRMCGGAKSTSLVFQVLSEETQGVDHPTTSLTKVIEGAPSGKCGARLLPLVLSMR